MGKKGHAHDVMSGETIHNKAYFVLHTNNLPIMLRRQNWSRVSLDKCSKTRHQGECS